MIDQNSFEGKSEKSGSKYYKVGNKKPPKETQFPPGVSGNPKGRPKGSKNKKGERYYNGIDDIILSEAYREVEVTENGRKVKMPVMQTAVRNQTTKAAKGDTRSFVSLIKNVSEIEHKRSEDKYRLLEAVISYKLEWKAEQKTCKALGLEMPDLELDPDDLFIDYETGEVFIVTPTKKQKQAIEKLFNIKKGLERDIQLYKQQLSNPDKVEMSEWYQDKLKWYQQLRTRIERLLT